MSQQPSGSDPSTWRSLQGERAVQILPNKATWLQSLDKKNGVQCGGFTSSKTLILGYTVKNWKCPLLCHGVRSKDSPHPQSCWNTEEELEGGSLPHMKSSYEAICPWPKHFTFIVLVGRLQSCDHQAGCRLLSEADLPSGATHSNGWACSTPE